MDRIRLIASDMDATLLDEYSQLPPKFTETIRALAGQGILFAAASGRPLYTLETMFPDLLEEIILIGDNGGAARCWSRPFWWPTTAALCAGAAKTCSSPAWSRRSGTG